MPLIGIVIDILPVLENAVKELKEATNDETNRFFKDLAIDAPAEMRHLMDTANRTGKTATRTTGSSFTRSAEGEVPGIESFDLYDSIVGEDEENSAIFEFAEHAFYLDPVFEGEGKGGGYLNRPFIEQGIENAVKMLESLQK